VMEKLGMTEEQVKELVKDGKLREFRDGAKQLFKAQEVDLLTTDTAELDIGAAGSVVELVPDESGRISLEPDSTAGTEDKAAPAGTGASGEINVSDLTGSEVNLGELTGADTNITTAGINVLAETDDDYKLTGTPKVRPGWPSPQKKS